MRHSIPISIARSRSSCSRATNIWRCGKDGSHARRVRSQDLASQRRAGPRRRPRGRPAVRSDGARRRGHVARPRRGALADAAPARRSHRPGCARARRRACRRCDPSRLQTRQRVRRSRRTRARRRLRPGCGGARPRGRARSRRAGDAERGAARHARVHGSRAATRRSGDRRERPVLIVRDGMGDRVWRAAVRGHDAGRARRGDGCAASRSAEGRSPDRDGAAPRFGQRARTTLPGRDRIHRNARAHHQAAAHVAHRRRRRRGSRGRDRRRRARVTRRSRSVRRQHRCARQRMDSESAHRPARCISHVGLTDRHQVAHTTSRAIDRWIERWTAMVRGVCHDRKSSAPRSTPHAISACAHEPASSPLYSRSSRAQMRRLSSVRRRPSPSSPISRVA